MTDINAVIAAFREPKPEYFHMSMLPCEPKNWKIKRAPDGSNLMAWEPVDFQHDARLYMALFEEMPYAVLIKHLDFYYVGFATKNFNDVPNLPDFKYNDKGTSICLAYCKLHGLECE